MASLDDKKAFSERLRQALKRSGKDVTSATQLAMQFNLRHPNEPITVQAAQKWLTGKARPTQDKMDTLARWLDISVDWLRFGISSEHQVSVESSVQIVSKEKITEQQINFLNKLSHLSKHQQELISDLVDQLCLERSLQARK